MTIVTVLAFDPGGSTGWAMWQAEKILNPEGKPEYFNEYTNSGCFDDKDHHEKIIALIELQRTEVFHLITEAFLNRPEKATASELISRDYIGVMTLWAKQNDVRLIQQSSAMAKTFINDKKLKAMGYWSTNKHARDAYRHMLFFMINNLQMTHLVDSWKELA
jgi:predicted 2-oxoglutarate/Fe(II)-dependent dioxygenase YbiX